MELLKSLTHPSELRALVQYKFLGGQNAVMPKLDCDALSPGMKRCYQLLNTTSRSFAAVIQALDDDLRPAICIFYLVLRALDTVEDDMTIPVEEKVPMLKQFHTYLYDPQWSYMNSKEKDKAVLEEFPTISTEFRALKQRFQEVISDITCKMGNGMCMFLQDEVVTMAQWDEYCHYVAGLVGIGLSQLFSASGLESEEVGRDQRLSNSMGLFLQKTNIIRDYLEDTLQGREFWPREGWSKFGRKLTDFQQLENREKAVQCLNHLITNALQHIPDVLEYLSRIRNQSVFNFCAIPQTMAIATLALCYNNPRVFTGVVKIRKGQAVDLIMQSTNMANVEAIFARFADKITANISVSDDSSQEISAIVNKVKKLCPHGNDPSSPSHKASLVGVVTIASLLAILYAYWSNYHRL